MSWKGWEDYRPAAAPPGVARRSGGTDIGDVYTSARGNKYHAQRIEIAGEVFDSKREAARWQQLHLRALAGEITGLMRQPSWDFVVNGVHVGSFTADFAYVDAATLTIIVEDAKSPATKRARDYPLRKKLMLACHGITIVEV